MANALNVNILVLSLSSLSNPRILCSTTLKIFWSLSTSEAAEIVADQSDDEAAVLMADAVLPACHLRAGDMMSVTTATKHGPNVPEEIIDNVTENNVVMIVTLRI